MPTLYFYPATTEFAPNKTTLRLMKLLHGYFSVTKKSWAHISQGWIMSQMQRHEKQTIPSSTLNYNLRILENHGFIERQKRHIRDNRTGHIVFRPSMYKITSKLRRFFRRFADWFRRSGWVPDLPRLGHLRLLPVVGAVTTQEEVVQEYRAQCLALQRKRRGPP